MVPPVDTLAVVYEDVEVEDAAATGMVVRIGNTRTFVGRYVPAEGTTVRHAGDRGRLALPRWFVEQHGLKPGQRVEVRARDAHADSVEVVSEEGGPTTLGARAASKLLVEPR